AAQLRESIGRAVRQDAIVIDRRLRGKRPGTLQRCQVRQGTGYWSKVRREDRTGGTVPFKTKSGCLVRHGLLLLLVMTGLALSACGGGSDAGSPSTPPTTNPPTIPTSNPPTNPTDAPPTVPPAVSTANPQHR